MYRQTLQAEKRRLEMINKLNWEIFSNKNRNIVIDEIKAVLLTNDACIVNSSMFSDLALSLSLEIEQKSVIELYNSLSSIVTISDLDTGSININSSKDCLIFINVSFTSGTGDLRIEMPAVPG